MEPAKPDEALNPEKQMLEGEDPYCLSRGSCCDDGEAPAPSPAMNRP